MEPFEPDYQAFEVLLKAGCLDQCDGHPGEYYDGGEQIEEAYKLGNTLISSGKIKLSNGETRRDFTDRIKVVYEDNSGPEICSYCQKLGINVMNVHDER